MAITRKDFFKGMCKTGVCLCGFSSIALSANNDNPGSANSPQDDKMALVQEWLSDLLSNLGMDLGDEALRKVMKKSSIVHYKNLKMDDILSAYIGKLDEFIRFIEDKWGWRVDYNKTTGILIADENKNYCVCPVSHYKDGDNSSAMCYCSEGFAEKMFSAVAGVSASATVISSIRRGDDRCKYRIVFS